jgi:uncharacterized protein (DUF1697 family)
MRLPHLALLRGVNVGGSHRLPMRELESAFTLAGGSAVKTYVQSGNVIFESNRPVDTCVDAAKAIEAQFGFRPAIIRRTAHAWRTMVEANPFLAASVAVETLHVACLKSAPPAAARELLDPTAFLPDEHVVADAHVYLRLPNGVARSALTTARLDNALGTVSTIRNWRTAIHLLELLVA